MDLRSEIVRFSICSVKNNKIKKHRTIFVKPVLGFVSNYCKGLTGISQKDVYLGLKLKDALKILEEEYSLSKKDLVVWSSQTTDSLKRDCFIKKVEFNLPKTIIDVKKKLSNMRAPKNAKELAELFIELKP